MARVGFSVGVRVGVRVRVRVGVRVRVLTGLPTARGPCIIESSQRLRYRTYAASTSVVSLPLHSQRLKTTGGGGLDTGTSTDHSRQEVKPTAKSRPFSHFQRNWCDQTSEGESGSSTTTTATTMEEYIPGCHSSDTETSTSTLKSKGDSTPPSRPLSARSGGGGGGGEGARAMSAALMGIASMSSNLSQSSDDDTLVDDAVSRSSSSSKSRSFIQGKEVVGGSPRTASSNRSIIEANRSRYADGENTFSGRMSDERMATNVSADTGMAVQQQRQVMQQRSFLSESQIQKYTSPTTSTTLDNLSRLTVDADSIIEKYNNNNSKITNNESVFSRGGADQSEINVMAGDAEAFNQQQQQNRRHSADLDRVGGTFGDKSQIDGSQYSRDLREKSVSATALDKSDKSASSQRQQPASDHRSSGDVISPRASHPPSSNSLRSSVDLPPPLASQKTAPYSASASNLSMYKENNVSNASASAVPRQSKIPKLIKSKAPSMSNLNYHHSHHHSNQASSSHNLSHQTLPTSKSHVSSLASSSLSSPQTVVIEGSAKTLDSSFIESNRMIMHRQSLQTMEQQENRHQQLQDAQQLQNAQEFMHDRQALQTERLQQQPLTIGRHVIPAASVTRDFEDNSTLTDSQHDSPIFTPRATPRGASGGAAVDRGHYKEGALGVPSSSAGANANDMSVSLANANDISISSADASVEASEQIDGVAGSILRRLAAEREARSGTVHVLPVSGSKQRRVVVAKPTTTKTTSTDDTTFTSVLKEPDDSGSTLTASFQQLNKRQQQQPSSKKDSSSSSSSKVADPKRASTPVKGEGEEDSGSSEDSHEISHIPSEEGISAGGDKTMESPPGHGEMILATGKGMKQDFRDARKSGQQDLQHQAQQLQHQAQQHRSNALPAVIPSAYETLAPVVPFSHGLTADLQNQQQLLLQQQQQQPALLTGQSLMSGPHAVKYFNDSTASVASGRSHSVLSGFGSSVSAFTPVANQQHQLIVQQQQQLQAVLSQLYQQQNGGGSALGGSMASVPLNLAAGYSVSGHPTSGLVFPPGISANDACQLLINRGAAASSIVSSSSSNNFDAASSLQQHPQQQQQQSAFMEPRQAIGTPKLENRTGIFAFDESPIKVEKEFEFDQVCCLGMSRQGYLNVENTSDIWLRCSLRTTTTSFSASSSSLNQDNDNAFLSSSSFSDFSVEDSVSLAPRLVGWLVCLSQKQVLGPPSTCKTTFQFDLA